MPTGQTCLLWLPKLLRTLIKLSSCLILLLHPLFGNAVPRQADCAHVQEPRVQTLQDVHTQVHVSGECQTLYCLGELRGRMLWRGRVCWISPGRMHKPALSALSSLLISGSKQPQRQRGLAALLHPTYTLVRISSSGSPPTTSCSCVPVLLAAVLCLPRCRLQPPVPWSNPAHP